MQTTTNDAHPLCTNADTVGPCTLAPRTRAPPRSRAGSPRPVDPRKLRADDLRYLLAVSRTGRLVTAADALGVDHTTVSRRIAALEKRLGLRLIERGPEG
ncbi:LysR family transcriptional regulator [Streptomyces sp. NPDC002888]|uniref:helix-turn-helix domain-containing protein n=1 Tax=Streptomyces sp. NPDC002888 TaxID=3364668 RepID=UPI0036869C30